MKNFFLWSCLFLATFSFGQQTSINALIGDTSWYVLHPQQCITTATETQRISTHLSYVVVQLKKNSKATQNNSPKRIQAIALLEKYIELGAYPCEFDHSPTRRPCFIDHAGNICAVGYLLEQTAGRDAAERINERYQYALITEMNDPGLRDWQQSIGLSMRELAMIQPAYGPPTSWTYYKDESNGKVGLKNRFTNDPITKAIYDHLHFNYNRPMYSSSSSGENLTGIAMIGGKWGAISTSGASIIPLEYDTLYWVRQGSEMAGNVTLGADRTQYLQAYLGKELRVFDYTGHQVFSMPQAQAIFQSDGLFIISLNGKQRFWNAANRSLVGKTYLHIVPTYPGQPPGFIVTNKLQGLASGDGVELIPCQYDRLEALSVHYWLCQTGTQRELFFPDGTQVALEPFSIATFLEHDKPNKLNVQIGNLHGLYEVSSKRWLLDVAFDEITAFTKRQKIWVTKGGYHGYFTLEGETVVPPIYDYVNPVAKGFVVRKDGKMGILLKQEEWIYPLEYDSIVTLGPYPSKLFALQKEGVWKLVKEDKSAFIDQTFSSFATIGGHDLVVGIQGNLHWAKLQANSITINTEVAFSSFAYGVQYTMVYCENGKYGLWERKNEDWPFTGQQTPALFDEIIDHPLKNQGVFPVKYQGKYGIIDLTGTFVVPAIYSHIDYSSDSHLYVKGAEGWYSFQSGNTLSKESTYVGEKLDARIKE